MSSNGRDASASPDHANQARNASLPLATSGSSVKSEPPSRTSKKVVICSQQNDNAETEKSTSRENTLNQLQANTVSNIRKHCQSPKSAPPSKPSAKSSSSSEPSPISANKSFDVLHYRSTIDADNHHIQHEFKNAPSNCSSSPRRTAAESVANSASPANSNTNRNINDRTASFSDDQTDLSPASRYRPQKYCAVCGDKAIACNFNAVTCESCKAFFRRNAFKEQRLKCLFDGRCVVDKVTRRFCSKCRLLKCFQIGMKREWILTDEQKQIKRVKILQNKQSKHHRQQQPDLTTSVPEIAPRSRSTNSVSNASLYLSQHSEGPKSHSMIEDEGSFKRQRLSSSLNYDEKPASVQKCDASTSCPDESLLLSGQIMHHCTMADQCQYCSLRLQSNGQTLHSVDQYQANYRFHSSHRQYFQYNQRQQHDYQLQQEQQQQQQQQQHQHQQHAQHFRYGQHAGHQYVGSPASSSAYSQHQIVASAALRTRTDLTAAGYPVNTANSSASGATQPPAAAGASQQTSPSVACAVPRSSGADCCCTNFTELSNSQRSGQQDGAANPADLLPIIDHFANQSPNESSGSNGSGAQATYTENVPMTQPNSSDQAASKNANPSTPGGSKAATGASDNAKSWPDSPITVADDLHSIMLATSAHSISYNPFVNALNAQKMSLEAPATSIDLVINGSTAANHKDTPDSSTTTAEGAEQKRRKSEPSPLTSTAIDATKLVTNNHTLPDGTPIDISKHVVWNGIVYAQPAIAESEMRARVETIDFTETERQLVYEMIEAIKFMFEPTTSDRSFNDTSLNDFVYFCDAALRRLIKTVKQIRAFRILGMDDQIMLLKTACFKILLLRSCLHYHDDIEGWRDRYGRIMPLSLLKKAKSMVYDKHKQILTKLSGPLRKDRMIMGFMSLVLLFDPQDNLKHTNSVGLDNLIYLCILRKYLISTQPDPLEKYERLVEATQVINACNEEYNVFFSRNFQPEQITPLLIEIFDISINNSV